MSKQIWSSHWNAFFLPTCKKVNKTQAFIWQCQFTPKKIKVPKDCIVSDYHILALDNHLYSHIHFHFFYIKLTENKSVYLLLNRRVEYAAQTVTHSANFFVCRQLHVNEYVHCVLHMSDWIPQRVLKLVLLPTISEQVILPTPFSLIINSSGSY